MPGNLDHLHILLTTNADETRHGCKHTCSTTWHQRLNMTTKCLLPVRSLQTSITRGDMRQQGHVDVADFQKLQLLPRGAKQTATSRPHPSQSTPHHLHLYSNTYTPRLTLQTPNTSKKTAPVKTKLSCTTQHPTNLRNVEVCKLVSLSLSKQNGSQPDLHASLIS